MLCSQCHERNAVVNLHQIADGEVVLLHLCERCAAEKGVDSGAALTKTPVGTFLASMGKGLDRRRRDHQRRGGQACPSCGATLDDFRESGRVGLRPVLPDLRDSTPRVAAPIARLEPSFW